MPSRTDHDRRDAQHACRATIAIEIGRYLRRVTEAGYAHIEETVTALEGDEHVDHTALGIAAAHRALASYGIYVGPDRTIAATPALDAATAELT